MKTRPVDLPNVSDQTRNHTNSEQKAKGARRGVLVQFERHRKPVKQVTQSLRAHRVAGEDIPKTAA